MSQMNSSSVKTMEEAPIDDVSVAQPTTTWERVAYSVVERLRVIYRMVVDTRPLPEGFPFDYALKNYLWRAIYMTAFTLGVRLGGLEVVELVVLAIFPSRLLFYLFYLLLPFGILIIQKATTVYWQRAAYSMCDVRVIVIVLAFMMGTVAAVFNDHYYIADGPPNYFMPILIGFAFQLVGPFLSNSRPKLITACVGSALAVGMVTASGLNALSNAAMFSLLVAAILAAINLQIMIGEILIGNNNITEAHIIALITALYLHTAICRLFGTYSDLPERQRTHLSLRKAIFN